jgi:hypothetical protein
MPIEMETAHQSMVRLLSSVQIPLAGCSPPCLFVMILEFFGKSFETMSNLSDREAIHDAFYMVSGKEKPRNIVRAIELGFPQAPGRLTCPYFL